MKVSVNSVQSVRFVWIRRHYICNESPSEEMSCWSLGRRFGLQMLADGRCWMGQRHDDIHDVHSGFGRLNIRYLGLQSL